MKILVTAKAKGLDAPTDARFGRAAYFVVQDMETGAVESHDNAQNLQAAQGAGIQAAQSAAGLGVGAVITGHCGPKAFRALQAAEIPVYVGAGGTVREAIEAYRSGALTEAAGADVEGHWV